MSKSLRSRMGWRLNYVLVVGFVLTAAVTLTVGFAVTRGVTNSYLTRAEQERVSRDMDLANAFYDLKLVDIWHMAIRLAEAPTVRAGLPEAAEGDILALQEIGAKIDNEFSVLSATSQRFVVVVDSQGRAISGRTCCRDGRIRLAVPNANWRELPIVASALSRGQAFMGTEVAPAEVLRWVSLEEQARIPLVDTPKAAPEPFDARSGTAGLVLAAVSPITSEEGQVIGALLVGHLFNNDFTLVDRIREVAGVDTATIFLGDQRVSTNVLDEQGERALGTRVSLEVYDKVLLRGEAFTGPAYVVNEWYISRYEPLYDHLGRIVGIYYVGARQATFQQLLDSLQRQVVLIGGATLLLAVLIAIPVAWFITRPLSNLAEATVKVAQGDWSVRVPTAGPLETGTLARAFNTMVETLKDTRDQLVQKEKLASLGQLAAGVAHEINNPLGSVLLFADILRKETPEEDTQQKDDLEMIIKEATRCKTIVTDLLNFSRQNEVLAHDTDLNELLGELAGEVKRKPSFEHIEVVEEFDPHLPHIQADPLQLRQVFLNLTNNAAEAMPDGGRLTIRTRPGPSEGYVSVDVQDTGVGISPENMKKLFTPFFTTKPIGKGTGLGLAIIYGIVKMHQGQISVQSQVNRGTAFTITLREQLPNVGQASQLVLE